MKLSTFELLAKSDIKVNWIVEGLISPGGWTFLVGDPKLGKSIMCLQLCSALQSGAEFLGRKTTRQNCLYIQSDAGLVEWAEQIRRIAGKSFAWTAHQLDPGWIDVEAERLRLHEIVWGIYTEAVQGSRGYAALTAALGGTPFTFVVLDCLHTLTNGDINTKTACNELRANINQIVTRKLQDPETGETTTLQVPYILVHHPSATVKTGTTAGAGWKGLSGDCTTKLSLVPDALILEGSKLTSKQTIILERDNRGAWILPSEASGREAMEGIITDFTEGIITNFQLALERRQNG